MVIVTASDLSQATPVKECVMSSSATTQQQQQLEAMMMMMPSLSSTSSSSFDDSASLDSRSPCSFSAPSPERDEEEEEEEDEDEDAKMVAEKLTASEPEGEQEEEEEEQNEKEEKPNLQDFVPEIVKNGVSVATLSDTQLDLSFSFETLRVFFHLPIAEAAQNLGVCTTILKKICRLKNIPRWPFRQMRSLDKMITNLETLNLVGQESALRTLADLKKRKESLLKDPNAIAEPLYHHRRKYRTITKRSKRQSEPKPPKTPKAPVKNVFHNVVAPTRYPGAPRNSSSPSPSSRSPSPPSGGLPAQVSVSQQPTDTPDSQPFVDPKKLFHPYYHFSIRRPSPSPAPEPSSPPTRAAPQPYNIHFDNDNNGPQPHSYPPHSPQLPPRPYWEQDQRQYQHQQEHQHPLPPSSSPYSQHHLQRDPYFPPPPPPPPHMNHNHNHHHQGPYPHHFVAPPPPPPAFHHHHHRFSNPDPNHVPPYPHHFDHHSPSPPSHPHHFLNHRAPSPHLPFPPHDFHRPFHASHPHPHPHPHAPFPHPYQHDLQERFEDDHFFHQDRPSFQPFSNPPPFPRQYQRQEPQAPEPFRIKQEKVEQDEETERSHMTPPRALPVLPVFDRPFSEELLNKQRPDELPTESLRSPFRDPSTGHFTLPSIRDGLDFARTPPTKIFPLEPPVYRS